MTAREAKRSVARTVTNRFVNPLVRALIERGAFPANWCLLETTGRRSGLPRRTPVGNGMRDGRFWIVTEHGWASDYVKNIAVAPRVRIKCGSRWYAGTARILPADDAQARLRELRRPLNDSVLRVMGTEQLVVRVDLDDAGAPGA